jgi:uncharacterized surface protein with fasciclin (FAS1) repeats
MKITFWRTGAPALLALSFALSLTAGATAPAPATLADTVARAPQLSTLNRLIAEAGLVDTLRAEAPFTLFAPSDEAFKAVSAKTLAELGGDKALLKSMLSYHLLPGKMLSAEVKNTNAKTVNGANLALAQAGTMVTVEDAVVVKADMLASNGVVHVIDRVLLPPRAR